MFAFDVAPGSLGETLLVFGKQAGVTIGVGDPNLAAVPSPGVRGRHAVVDGLRRLLKGTGAHFVVVDPQTIRIVQPPRQPTGPKQGRIAVPPAASAADLSDPTDIVVTASKQPMRLGRYPGTVEILDLGAGPQARLAARGTSAVLARLPALASTDLGPGRNKLFIRGVADSSFNGPTQATVGQYLGDVRLNYSAPDPNLNLYDIGRVEILEGPQGTLYGTGSLGGVVRLIPNAPNARMAEARATAGTIATEHGGIGGDLAAMVNLPIADDRLALRSIAYVTVDPGYIDDPFRGRRNINRTTTSGGRTTLRYLPGEGWTLDLGGVLHNISSRNGQYVRRDAPPLTRSSRIAQPYHSDYRLGQLTIGRQWRDLTLTSTTAIVSQSTSTTFDATPDGTGAAVAFVEDIGIELFSHETRLAGGGSRSWVAGVSGFRDISRLTRRRGDPDDPPVIAGVRNRNSEAAAFGQYSLPLSGRLTATAGSRLVFAHTGGALLDAPDDAPSPSRNAFRVLPMGALAWQLGDRLLVYVHYQQGFRAGGLVVAPSGSAEESQEFTGDSLKLAEVGLRFGQRGHDTLSASGALSWTRWSDIQADLIDDSGLPFTTNIGDGRIYGVQLQVAWMPMRDLTLEASMFLNNSALYSPEPDFAAAEDLELPNITTTAARAGFAYSTDLSPAIRLTVDGSLRYVGESQLGIGEPLDVSQGDYFEAAAGVRLVRGRFAVSLDIDNLADTKGNRFAFGNPFGVAARDQITPLRPRTLRLGIDARF